MFITGGDIKTFNFAVSDQNGEIELFIPHTDKMGGRASIHKRENIEIEKVRIKTVTIDAFVKENRIERVNFIKIDAEGAEREIIKGAKKTIKEFKPMAISAYHLLDDKEKISESILSIRDDQTLHSLF
jgi:FkbM family methyltransferase